MVNKTQAGVVPIKYRFKKSKDEGKNIHLFCILFDQNPHRTKAETLCPWVPGFLPRQFLGIFRLSRIIRHIIYCRILVNLKTKNMLGHSCLGALLTQTWEVSTVGLDVLYICRQVSNVTF